MTRDSFRTKTYEAENELRFLANTGVSQVDFYGTTLELPEPRKFGDLAGVQRFVDAVCEMDVVREAYPTSDWRPAPKVQPYGGTKKAYYRMIDNVIRVPDHQGVKSSWAMNEFVVLHELAHYFVAGVEKDTGVHGTEFCLCFIFLLRNVLGGGWATLLMHNLDKNGVPLNVGSTA